MTGTFVAIQASVASDRFVVTLDRIRAAAVLLGNRRVTVNGGSFSAASWETGLQMGDGSRVERATLSCSQEGCLSAQGSSLIRDCTFAVNTSAPAIGITGSDTTVDGNTLDGWITISGDRNVVARNISSGGRPYIEIYGAGNILEGNIGPSIVFETPANFYGNNRVAMPGGFSGTDGNVDWGGNVSY